MIIEKILKELTPERVKKEIEELQIIKLPSALKKWMKLYKKVSNRSDYLWLWSYKSVQLVTLPDVSLKYRKSLYETKCLTVMFVTLLDDVADRMRNKKLLHEILKVPFSKKSDIKFRHLNFQEKEYLKFTIKLWRQIINSIKSYPRCEEFKEIFEYDFAQTINSIRYAYLVNTNHNLINKTEYWLYFPHNLPIILNFTIDLMCYLNFDMKELGVIREVGWEAQKIGQTMNWITTWEREVEEEDFTSGVFAYAIEFGILKSDELNKKNKVKAIKKIKNEKIEDELFKECLSPYKEIKKMAKKVKTVNIEKFLSGLEELIVLQLSSRGNY